MDGEGVIRGGLVPLVEVVDELLHPHRVRVGQVAVVKEAPGHGIGRGVNVYGEGGEMVVLGINERVDAVVPEEGQVVGCVVDRGRAADGVETLGLRALGSHDHGLLLGRRRGRRRGWGRCGLVAGATGGARQQQGHCQGYDCFQECRVHLIASVI